MFDDEDLLSFWREKSKIGMDEQQVLVKRSGDKQ
jgi:hypothetical protein